MAHLSGRFPAVGFIQVLPLTACQSTGPYRTLLVPLIGDIWSLIVAT